MSEIGALPQGIAMYSFLLAIGERSKSENLLERSRKVTEQLIPRASNELSHRERRFSSIAGGVYYFLPGPEEEGSLLHEHFVESHYVFVFGIIACQPGDSPAKRVWRTWRDEGLEGVRALPGSFSAIIVDFDESAIEVVSDIVGRHTLRYFHRDDLFLVSNHDLPIVATGECSTEIDWISAASAVAVEWSLGGASLLKDVNVCRSTEVLRWRFGRLSTRSAPIVNFEERPDIDDVVAGKRLLSTAAQALEEGVRNTGADAKEIRVSLTGGIDSRVVFGLALSALGRTGLTTFTRGQADSLDCRLARRLSILYGVPHQTLPATRRCGEDAFLSNSDLLAYFENGVSNAKRALRDKFQFKRSGPVNFSGSGGEIVRGYYYPREPRDQCPDMEWVRKHLMERFRALGTLPWRAQEIRSGLATRLVTVLEDLEGISENTWDVLDLFYLLERFARWSPGPRWLWSAAHQYAPFGNPNFIRLAFCLPSPIGQKARIHRYLIRRNTPAGYWLSINGGPSLGEQENRWTGRAVSIAKRFPRKLDKLVSDLRDRFSSADQRYARASSEMDMSRAMSNESTMNVIRSALLQDGSISLELLRKDALIEMIERHASGTRLSTQELGCLFTVERWRRQVQRASHLARAR